LRVDFADIIAPVFCIRRSKGVAMYDFVRYFNGDTGINDVIVHELVCSMM